MPSHVHSQLVLKSYHRSSYHSKEIFLVVCWTTSSRQKDIVLRMHKRPEKCPSFYRRKACMISETVLKEKIPYTKVSQRPGIILFLHQLFAVMAIFVKVQTHVSSNRKLKKLLHKRMFQTNVGWGSVWIVQIRRIISQRQSQTARKWYIILNYNYLNQYNYLYFYSNKDS